MRQEYRGAAPNCFQYCSLNGFTFVPTASSLVSAPGQRQSDAARVLEHVQSKLK